MTQEQETFPLPRSCPKCGAIIPGDRQTKVGRFLIHLRQVHHGALGVAVPKEWDAEPRMFSYVGPAYQRSNAWVVVWHDWPYETAILDRDKFIVTWVHPGEAFRL